MSIIQADEMIQNELLDAELKHPNWPVDPVHGVAIMVEEAGEAMQAVLNYVYHGGSLDNVRNEVVQTAAMCYRVLKNLHRY